MSVLIKGMKPPNDCYECPCKKWVDDGCAGCWADDKIHNASRPNDCPLVEIPEPHGDLIDRDELAKNTILCVTHPPYITATDIKNASTVIPREDGETDGQD